MSDVSNQQNWFFCLHLKTPPPPSLMDSMQPGGRRTTTFSLCCALACDSISTSVTCRTFHLCLLYFRSDTFPQKMHLPVCYVLASSVQNSFRSFFFYQVFRRKSTISFNSVRRAFNHIILLNYPQVSAHLTPVESNLSAGSSAPASAVGLVGVCGGWRVQERDR